MTHTPRTSSSDAGHDLWRLPCDKGTCDNNLYIRDVDVYLCFTRENPVLMLLLSFHVLSL